MPGLFKKKTSSTNQGSENLSHQELKKLFLLVILSESNLQAALVSKNQDLKASSAIRQYFDQADLTTQLDQALQDLGPAADDVADCVFIFDDQWLKDGDLIAAKKVIVQELAESLSLTVLGQLSLIDGIYQARLALDPHDSSLFIYLQEQTFDLSLIKHGQLLSRSSIGRSGKIAADLQEGLARISQDLGEEGKYFPNKIYLTSLNDNQKALAKDRERLMAFDWTSFSSFLQIPEFEVLESDYLIKALASVAGLALTDDKKDLRAAKLAPATPLETSPEDDNLKPAPKATSFGIELGTENLAAAQTNKKKKPVKAVKKTKSKQPLVRFWQKNKRALTIGVGAGLLALTILTILFALFLSKVKVKLRPAEEFLQKQLTIILDPSLTESDFENYLLKANIETKDLTGEDVMTTTGTSLIGEKAKGKVKLFNKTEADKTFEAGTELSYEDLVFVLDEEVTVAAAIEDEDGGGIDYGSSEANVTAAEIGADYNLEKDAKLRVAAYYDDTYAATVMENLSGGSSREVQVVSQEDMNLLAGRLKETLAELAIEEFASDSKDGVYLVPTGNSRTIDFSYDHEEGAEVDSLGLKMTLQFEAIKYLSTDLKQLAEAALAQDLPENYVFIDEEPLLMSDEAQPSEDDPAILLLKTELSAKAQALLDKEQLQASLLDQEQDQALSLLRDNELIQDAEIIYQPAFMANLLKRLPANKERLELIIE